MSSLTEQYYEVYQQARKNMEDGKGSVVDEVLVRQWDLIREQIKTIADQEYRLSLMESREVTSESFNEVAGMLTKHMLH